jgi:hypothetical protein
MGISLCFGQFDVYVYYKNCKGKNMCDYKLCVVYKGYVKFMHFFDTKPRVELTKLV